MGINKYSEPASLEDIETTEEEAETAEKNNE
jgi:hypothetical protein